MSTTTTIRDGHGSTDFSSRLAAMIRDEGLSVRETVSAVAHALQQAIEGQSVTDGAAHDYGVDSQGRLVSVMVYEMGARVSIGDMHEAMVRLVDAERATQPQEV